MNMDYEDFKITGDLCDIECGLHHLTELLRAAQQADTGTCILRDYYNKDKNTNAVVWLERNYDFIRAALAVAGSFMDVVSAGLTNEEIKLISAEKYQQLTATQNTNKAR